MLQFIYAQPLCIVILEIVVIIPFWSYLGKYLMNVCKRERFWKLVNCLLLMAAVSIILYATVLDRDPNQREVILRPLQSFIEAKEQPEIYRAMLMNVLLFVPFGLSLPECLPRRWHLSYRILLTVLCGFLFSCGMEFLQYQYCLGRAETDDVLCNTLGAALASTASIWKTLLSQNSPAP